MRERTNCIPSARSIPSILANRSIWANLETLCATPNTFGRAIKNKGIHCPGFHRPSSTAVASRSLSKDTHRSTERACETTLRPPKLVDVPSCKHSPSVSNEAALRNCPDNEIGRSVLHRIVGVLPLTPDRPVRSLRYSNAKRPQEKGIHVHVHDGARRVVDDTYSEVILDGRPLSRTELIELM